MLIVAPLVKMALPHNKRVEKEINLIDAISEVKKTTEFEVFGTKLEENLLETSTRILPASRWAGKV